MQPIKICFQSRRVRALRATQLVRTGGAALFSAFDLRHLEVPDADGVVALALEPPVHRVLEVLEDRRR